MKNTLLFAVTGLLFATPATAEIKSQSDAGFVIGHTAVVLAKPDDVWKRLISPKDWWNPSHSWSGKTDSFYIDAQAGGCFCELLQDTGADGVVKPRGSVEHMRVIFADPGKVLRMQGALGPLQSEAMFGTLTVAMEPLKDGAGTRLSLSYVVGGFMRYKMKDVGPSVDGVLGDQFQRLIKPLGRVIATDDAKPDQWSLDPDKLEDKATQSPTKAEPEKPKTGKPEKVEADTTKDGR